MCQMLPTPSSKPFKFSSTHGWQICSEIITNNLAIQTHNYQLKEITCRDATFLCSLGAGVSGFSLFGHLLVRFFCGRGTESY